MPRPASKGRGRPRCLRSAASDAGASCSQRGRGVTPRCGKRAPPGTVVTRNARDAQRLFDRTDLDISKAGARPLGRDLDRLIQVARFDQKKTAKLLLGLREGPVRDPELAFTNPQRGGVARALQRIAVIR